MRGITKQNAMLNEECQFFDIAYFSGSQPF